MLSRPIASVFGLPQLELESSRSSEAPGWKAERGKRRRLLRRRGSDRLDGGTRAELAQPRGLDGRHGGSSRCLGGGNVGLPVTACYSLSAGETDVGDSTGTVPVGTPFREQCHPRQKSTPLIGEALQTRRAHRLPVRLHLA
jgi:hypothetical protein